MLVVGADGLIDTEMVCSSSDLNGKKNSSEHLLKPISQDCIQVAALRNCQQVLCEVMMIPPFTWVSNQQHLIYKTIMAIVLLQQSG